MRILSALICLCAVISTASAGEIVMPGEFSKEIEKANVASTISNEFLIRVYPEGFDGRYLILSDQRTRQLKMKYSDASALARDLQRRGTVLTCRNISDGSGVGKCVIDSLDVSE